VQGLRSSASSGAGWHLAEPLQRQFLLLNLPFEIVEPVQPMPVHMRGRFAERTLRISASQPVESPSLRASSSLRIVYARVNGRRPG
jgi:hypothetical protein